MKLRLIALILILTCCALYAQRPASGPPPVPAFSQELIKAHTPEANPPSDAKVRLGDMLFDDKRLSSDDSVACNMCHSPRNGFTAHIETAKGVRDQLGKRNAPTILNTIFSKTQFWDGRAATLEEQAMLPILNPIEMGQKSPEDVVAKIAAIPEFVEAFQQVFGRPVNWEDMGRAIAAFERTRLSTEAPIDRFLKGQQDALTESQRRGWALFNGKAHCSRCHAYDANLPTFGDSEFRNTGIAARKSNFTEIAARASDAVTTSNKAEIDRIALETDNSELGRFLVTKNRSDIGAFKTPFLRDVLLTAPYMHDGSVATLRDVVAYYSNGGQANPFLDPKIEPLNLRQEEIDDLVNLLVAFTSDRSTAQGDTELQKQRTLRSDSPVK